MSRCIEYAYEPITETVYQTAEPAWDGSAVFQELLAKDGVFQFWVPDSVVGVIVGLSRNATGSEADDIDAGVRFSNGQIRAVWHGDDHAIIGSAGYEVYSLLRQNGIVYFFGSAADEWVDDSRFRLPVPGALLYTFPEDLPGTVAYKLYIYSGSDILKGGYLKEWGAAGAVAQTCTVLGGEAAYGQGRVLFEAPTVTGTVTINSFGHGAVALGYDVLGSEDSHSQGAVRFPALVVSGTGEAPVYGVARFEPAYAVGADYAYSFGQVEMHPTVTGRESAGVSVDYSAGLAVFAPGRVSGFESGTYARGHATFGSPDVLGSEDGYYAQGAASLGYPDAFGEGSITPTAYLRFRLYNVLMRTGHLPVSMRETTLVGAMDAVSSGTIYTRRVLQAEASSGAATFYHPSSLVADAVSADVQAVPTQIEQLLLDGLAGSELDAVTAVHAAEVLYAQGAVQTFYQGFVEAALAAQALVEMPEGGLYQQRETLAAQVEDTGLIRQVAQWADEALAVLNTENRGVFVVRDELVAESNDLAEVMARLLHQGTLSTGAWLGLRLSGEVHTAWATNLEGSLPVSQYENFGFNSFANVGGEYFAASEDGLYRLGADQDDGQPIDAAVGSMMLDMGTSRQKRVQAAYIGYTASGRIMLKVRSEDDGQVVEDWFEAQQQTAAAPRNQMVRIGRGLRSRYWQFELMNVQGADFELDSLEMYPVPLNRRV